MFRLSTIDELAAQLPDGARVAVPKDDTGVPVSLTLALIRRGARRLRLVCVPVSGLQADLLIGAGCVESIETSAVSLGEFGAAPRFTDAMRAGTVGILDATCPAIYAGLQAGQKGIPFMPLRGILETDVLAHRPDWKIIDNPFHAGDRIVAISAIVPDVAIFHAQAVDAHGNVFLGRDRDGLLLAHASRAALVTVERVESGNFLDDPDRAGSVVPALYVSAVAHAPQGCWPLPLAGAPVGYAADAEWMLGYARDARTPEGFEARLADLQARVGHADPVSA